MLPVLFSLFLPAAQAVECGTPVDPAEVDAALTAAETEFSGLNEAGFRDKMNEANGILLPCVREPLPPEVVAHHHRVMALNLLLVGDEPAALRAAEAARVANPDYAFSDDFLAPDHPVRAHYEAYEPDQKTRTVPEPRVGHLTFDGQTTRDRPKTHPTIAQLFDGQGNAVSTRWLAARDPLPEYRAIPRRRTTLIIGSGAALLLAGTTYGMAWAQRGNLFESAKDPNTDADTLNAKRGRTNALTFVSGAFLGVSIGLGAGAATIGEQ
jgi:hypothetical protein